MFLEKLVAQGAPFMDYGMNPEETLRQITDVTSDGRFLENVLVIEGVFVDGEIKFSALPLMTWGNYEIVESIAKKRSTKKKRIFKPDTGRGLALPFVLPSGGNPTTPQGRYGVSVYPVYPKSFALLTNQKETVGFISNRLQRTINLPVKFSDGEISAIALCISNLAVKVQERIEAKENQGYGLIALVLPDAGQCYRYRDSVPVIGDIEYVLVGKSLLFDDKYIAAYLPLLEKNFWDSKIAEGLEKGQRSKCSICGRVAESISPYCKAWNWLSYTWDCPLSERYRGKEPDLASAIGALCRECYSSLIMGAGIFEELSAPLPYRLTKELFVPTASAGGREALKNSKNRPPEITGCALIVPFMNGTDTGNSRETLKEALDVFRTKNLRKGKNDRSLAAITGFESVLPDDFSSDDYRLTIVYYQKSQADVQLRTVIEDVLPSTVKFLADQMPAIADEALEIKRRIAETEKDFSAENYRSLIYLLIRAYGGGYLWYTLRSILSRKPVSTEKFVRGTALRLNGYAAGQDANQFWNMREEVAFYLVFRKFINFYNNILLKEGKELRDWRQMLDKAAKTPPEKLSFDNVEELGFAAGFLNSRFGRWYWHSTGGSGKGKDFVKHKLMGFSSKLTPDMVWRRGLIRFYEYAAKLDINLPEDFRRRTGVVESEYRRLREQVERKRDEFIGSFWSGYMLANEAGRDENLNKKED